MLPPRFKHVRLKLKAHLTGPQEYHVRPLDCWWFFFLEREPCPRT
jgi:hypothetical protein